MDAKNKNEPPFLLFDIGGTSTRFGISLDGEKVDETFIFPTPKKFEEGISLFKDFKEKKEINFKSVAGGIAGPLDKSKSKVVSAPNLNDWANEPFKKKLENLFNCEVYLENDTAMAGLGEAVYGAGDGYEIVVYITVSTGVNGVRIVRKDFDDNIFGFEIGHQIVDLDKTVKPVGDGKGELESLVSGSGIEKRYDKDPREVKDKKVWSEAAKILAYGLNNTIVHWSPEVVVLGGSMITKNTISLKETKKHLDNILTIFNKLPELKMAELGDYSGLHGSLHFLRMNNHK